MLAAEDKTTQGQTVSELLDGNFIIPAKDVLLSIIQFMELALDLHQQQKTHGNISIDNLVIHKEKDKPPVVSLRDPESVPASASNDIYTNVRDVAIVIKTMLEHDSIKARFKTESKKIKKLQQDFLDFANEAIKKINVEQMASAEVLHDLMNKIPEIEAKESHVSEQQFKENFAQTVKEMKEVFDELCYKEQQQEQKREKAENAAMASEEIETQLLIANEKREKNKIELDSLKNSVPAITVTKSPQNQNEIVENVEQIEQKVILRRKSTIHDTQNQRIITAARLKNSEDPLSKIFVALAQLDDVEDGARIVLPENNSMATYLADADGKAIDISDDELKGLLSELSHAFIKRSGAWYMHLDPRKNFTKETTVVLLADKTGKTEPAMINVGRPVKQSVVRQLFDSASPETTSNSDEQKDASFSNISPPSTVSESSQRIDKTALLQKRIQELEEKLAVAQATSTDSFVDNRDSLNGDAGRHNGAIRPFFQSQSSASVFPVKTLTAFEVAREELKAAAAEYIAHSKSAKSSVDTSRKSETSSSGASAGWGFSFNIFTSPGKHGKKGETNAATLLGKADIAKNIHELKVAVQEVANAYWLLGSSKHSLVSFIGPKTNLLVALGVSPEAYALPVEANNNWHFQEAKSQRAILLAALKNLDLEVTAENNEHLSKGSSNS